MTRTRSLWSLGHDGVKRAYLTWHKKLCADLPSPGFDELCGTPCVQRRKSDHSAFIYVLDDILVLAPTVTERDTVVEQLKGMFELRLSDTVELFLGVQLKWEVDSNGNVTPRFMSQLLYIESVLRRFGMQGSKSAITPMVELFFTGLVPEKNKNRVDVTRHQEMVGLFCTRHCDPDWVFWLR